jgi:hypothetical protein
VQVDAFLCDAATVREGLLNVLGAGITRIWREGFPAPLGMQLAFVLTVHPTEAAEQHRFRVVVQNADGATVAQIDAEFGLNPPLDATPGPGPQPGEMLAAPAVLDLRNVGVPEPGAYSVELLLDGQHVRSLPFIAAVPAGEGMDAPPEIAT